MSVDILVKGKYNKEAKTKISNITDIYNNSFLEFPKYETNMKILDNRIKITFNGINTLTCFSDVCRNFDKMIQEIEKIIDKEKFQDIHSGSFNYQNLNYKVFWTFDMNKRLLLDVVTM